MMKRKAIRALLAAGITIVSTGLVRAQSDSLAGIWEETATFLDITRPDVRALIVYNKDGTLVATEGGSVVFDPPAKNPHTPQTGSVTSNDIGVWVDVTTPGGPPTFEYTSYVLFSDFSGKPAGKLIVSGRYTLNEIGDHYSGESHFQVLDDNNQPVPGASGTVHNEGKRLPFVAPPAPTPP